MTISYSTPVANNRLQQVANAVDGGAGNGVLVIGTAALSGATGVLATIILQKPCATISNRVLSISGAPLSVLATGAGTQTAAKAELRDSAGTVIASGLTVGVGAAFDININSTSVSIGQTVQLNAGTITHP